jgi:hypothetical protein
MNKKMVEIITLKIIMMLKVIFSFKDNGKEMRL